MMRRKFFATVLALALSVATMVGCGSSADSAAGMGGDTGPAAYADGTAEVVDESPAEIAEPDNTSQGLADVAGENDDFGRPPEEDLVPWDVEAGEEDVTEEVPVTGEIEGIIMLQADYKTNSFAPTFVVSAINPQSGEYHMISSFVFEHVARVQEDEFIVDPAYEMARYYNYRGMFNKDYTLMAATKTFLGNEESHVGWVNQSGEFFDVTEALGENRQSDFEDTKHYEAVGFTPDNSFIYADIEDYHHPVYYMVPVDNILPGASYHVENTHPYIMDVYSDTWRWIDDIKPTCWVDDGQFLAVRRSGQAMTCIKVTISSQSVDEIVPIGSQTSWSPVLGPDGSSVAFLSAPLEGTENPSIYLTNVSRDGTPTKLETPYTPLCGRVADNGSVLSNISLAYYYASILEWR